jgi:hypothetical protein
VDPVPQVLNSETADTRVSLAEQSLSRENWNFSVSKFPQLQNGASPLNSGVSQLPTDVTSVTRERSKLTLVRHKVVRVLN